jgi:thiol-disulfide isomerase/thioredoxin
MRKFQIIGLLILLLVAVILVLPGDGHDKPVLPVQKNSQTIKAPDFRLEKYGGGEIQLSDFKGKVVLLNFWATWCPPCRHELPDIAKLREELKGKGFEVIGIILERKDPNVISKVEKLKNEFGMKYPLAWGTNQVVVDYGNISSIPQSFIIDKNGNVVKVFIGARSYTAFKKVVEPLL